MKQTLIELEILEDGTISVTSGDVAGTHHVSADELLDCIAELQGGERTTVARKRPAYAHVHAHGGKVHAH